MTTIKIQQHPNDLQKATLSFSHGTNYEIEIKSPFNEKQEQNLEWYFEEYLKFPFTDGVKFQQTAESIKSYGENLFQQLFNNVDAYNDYQKALAQSIELEIIDSMHFQAV